MNDPWAGAEALPHTEVGRAARARPVAWRDGVIIAVEMEMYCPQGQHSALFTVSSGQMRCQHCGRTYHA